MAASAVTWKGAEKFKRQLAILPKAIAAAAKDAMAEGADTIVNAMKALVTVESGDLRDSIQWQWLPGTARKPFRIRITAGGALTTKIGKSGRPYDHAMAVEFGTMEMHAEPFFWPTWRAQRRSVKSRIMRRVSAAIKAEAARAG